MCALLEIAKRPIFIRKHIIMYMYLETSQLNSDIVEWGGGGGDQTILFNLLVDL